MCWSLKARLQNITPGTVGLVRTLPGEQREGANMSRSSSFIQGMSFATEECFLRKKGTECLISQDFLKFPPSVHK